MIAGDIDPSDFKDMDIFRQGHEIAMIHLTVDKNKKELQGRVVEKERCAEPRKEQLMK